MDDGTIPHALELAAVLLQPLWQELKQGHLIEKRMQALQAAAPPKSTNPQPQALDSIAKPTIGAAWPW